MIDSISNNSIQINLKFTFTMYQYIIVYGYISYYTIWYIYIYVCVSMCLSAHKWPTNKMSVIYMESWKQCALPVITTIALWQLMYLGTLISYILFIDKLCVLTLSQHIHTLVTLSHLHNLYQLVYLIIVTRENSLPNREHDRSYQ